MDKILGNILIGYTFIAIIYMYRRYKYEKLRKQNNMQRQKFKKEK